LGARGCVSTVTKLPARLAAGVLAAVLGSALVVNVVRIARHPEDLAPVAAGALAPDFTLSRVDGTPGTVTLSNLRAKIVVLDFWARWCPPCLAMLSALHALHAEWQPRGVEFLGINAEGSHTQREEIEEFLRGHRSPFPMLLDDRQVGGLYGVRSVPHLVVIGRDGRVGKVIVGQAGKAEVAAAIRAVDGAVR
jgi:peroxiredoxin